jgi:hypothetical protein
LTTSLAILNLSQSKGEQDRVEQEKKLKLTNPIRKRANKKLDINEINLKLSREGIEPPLILINPFFYRESPLPFGHLPYYLNF